ncbi:MAG: hypothetical protein DRN12_06310, partial [Thermoplasmata archaeon]
MVDHDYIKVSTDGGITWDTVADLVSYGVNHYEWPITINLSAYDGQTIKIAFNKYYDGVSSGSIAWWIIDKVEIIGSLPVTDKHKEGYVYSDKWALICVSTNDFYGDHLDQYQLNDQDKQPVNGFAWQEFIPDCNSIYYFVFTLDTPSGAGPVNISIRTNPTNPSTSLIYTGDWYPDSGYHDWYWYLYLSVNAHTPYYFVVECNPTDNYQMGGAIAPVYTNGGTSNLDPSIPGWNWYFEDHCNEYADMDGFPAQGLQAYYTLKTHGYRDDHIIFMLWHNDECDFSNCEPNEDNDGTDEYITIYGGHNDLLGPPPQIGGPNQAPQIDYDHNTLLPAGVNNWYELLQYNINWLANHVGPNDDVVIYLVNHGGYNYYNNNEGDYFFEDGSGPVDESTFDSWVDNINCKRLTILIDSCYSGDFIDAPTDPGLDSGIDSENNRILVSASDHCTAIYWVDKRIWPNSPYAGSFFFHHFWNRINGGWSIQQAYNFAKNQIESGSTIWNWQKPQIVDKMGDSGKYSPVIEENVVASTVFSLHPIYNVDATYYRIWYSGTWSSWMLYTGPFTISGTGKHYIEWYSIKGSNVEEIHNETDMIDNFSPVASNPFPANGATNVPITLSQLSVDIADPDGDTFDWTIETSPNIGSSSGTGESDGTKTCSISGLQYGTTYTWYVNATDPSGSGTYTRAVYTFTTKTNNPPTFSNENPANGATNVPITLSQLSIDIADPDGDTFDWTIETSPNIGSSSGTGESNGTKTCSISGLQYGTTYTWYVNATDPSGSGTYTRAFYTFTTKTNNPPTFSNENPANGATNVPITLSQLSIDIADPDGDTFDWTIETSPN